MIMTAAAGRGLSEYRGSFISAVSSSVSPGLLSDIEVTNRDVTESTLRHRSSRSLERRFLFLSVGLRHEFPLLLDRNKIFL